MGSAIALHRRQRHVGKENLSILAERLPDRVHGLDERLIRNISLGSDDHLGLVGERFLDLDHFLVQSGKVECSVAPLGMVGAPPVLAVGDWPSGCSPRTAPVPATKKALQRGDLKIDDLGLIELNEAFASQSIACIYDLGLDLEKVNVNGGSIAIGHPLGCSGVRISTTLLHEMKRRNTKYGLATMCVGVGQGAAVIYEQV